MDTESYRQKLQECAGMPLYDAAYVLWSKRLELNKLEGHLPKPVDIDPRNFEQVKQLIAVAYRTLVLEAESAHREGVTFDRLRATHPEEDAESVGEAIVAAKELMAYCNKHAWDDVPWGIKIERLVANHPGFLHETYSRAYTDGVAAMR